jgi:hypothetical protein
MFWEKFPRTAERAQGFKKNPFPRTILLTPPDFGRKNITGAANSGEWHVGRMYEESLATFISANLRPNY